MITGKATNHDLADVYALTARLFAYPDGELGGNIEAAFALIGRAHPTALGRLKEFVEEMSGMDLKAMEELYVATFDVNAACCLDVGYAIFGEDYKRGQCMAEIKVLQAKYEVDCGSELPDFLPNVLRLLPRMPYGDAAEFVRSLVIPAIDKMIGSFAARKNPYRHLLALAGDVLKRDYSA